MESTGLPAFEARIPIQTLPLEASRRISTPQAPEMLIGIVVSTGELEGELDQDLRGQLIVEFAFGHSAPRRISAELVKGLSVTAGDRVLFARPANSTIAIITSVLEPVSRQTSTACVSVVASQERRTTNQELILHDAETLRITTCTGQTLIAIESGASGPIIRLGQGGLELDMPGELHLMADSLRFTTRSGPLCIDAQADDVIVQGRTIRLN